LPTIHPAPRPVPSSAAANLTHGSRSEGRSVDPGLACAAVCLLLEILIVRGHSVVRLRAEVLSLVTSSACSNARVPVPLAALRSSLLAAASRILPSRVPPSR
jgi:hypothetical protein